LKKLVLVLGTSRYVEILKMFPSLLRHNFLPVKKEIINVMYLGVLGYTLGSG